MYYYEKNLQGDVVEIINQAGTVYATYEDDAWGNIKSVSGQPILRELNPFRYRSYVYDNESGLFYLQSRYYDPFVGRFLNADVYCDTQSGSPLSTNMFAYCENNSVTNLDVFGYKTTRIVSISPSSRYYISFGNKSLSKKSFICYLTTTWIKADSYSISKSVTVETTLTGNISGSYLRVVSGSVGVSLKISVNASTSATIKANRKKYSKLALYEKFNLWPFTITMQNIVYK